VNNVHFWVKLQGRLAKITLGRNLKAASWRKATDNLVLSFTWLFNGRYITQYTTMARRVGRYWKVITKEAKCELWGSNKGEVSGNGDFRFPLWKDVSSRVYSQVDAYVG
jgi:hypothetical protein